MIKSIKKNKIFVAGHKGLVGSAIIRCLIKNKYKNIHFKKRKELNLLDQDKVFKYLKKNKFDYIFIAAAKVGGINANNTLRANFIYENLQIQNNLIHGAFLSGTKHLIFLGSSCIYPKHSAQPIKEEYLLSNKLEYTNEPYAIAKISGIKMCEAYNYQYGTNYKCLMPTNTFGPNDNYDLLNSHFIPAIIRKVIEAKKNYKKKINLWGNGKAKREIIYVDDIAEACIYFIGKKTKKSLINIGSGYELNIKEFANKIKNFIHPSLLVNFNKNQLNGTKKKLMSSSLAKKYGWKSRFNIDEALKLTIEDVKKNNYF